jgi:sialidase-1
MRLPRAKFPETKFEFINAGIGSMGSVPHAFRLERDVLSKGPVDLLFVEAAVNDSSNIPQHPDLMLRGMEGVVRHAAQVNPLTDIIQLHFVMPPHMDDYHAGKVPASIAQHEKVAVAYGNPSLNLARRSHRPHRRGRIHLGQGFQRPASLRLRSSALRQQHRPHARHRFCQTHGRCRERAHAPAMVDAQSYAKGRLGNIAQAKNHQRLHAGASVEACRRTSSQTAKRSACARAL